MRHHVMSAKCDVFVASVAQALETCFMKHAHAVAIIAREWCMLAHWGAPCFR